MPCHIPDQMQLTKKVYPIISKKFLKDNDLMDKACYIYNMDKTGVPLDHKPPKRNEESAWIIIAEQKPNYCSCLLKCSWYSASTYGHL